MEKLLSAFPRGWGAGLCVHGSGSFHRLPRSVTAHPSVVVAFRSKALGDWQSSAECAGPGYFIHRCPRNQSNFRTRSRPSSLLAQHWCHAGSVSAHIVRSMRLPCEQRSEMLLRFIRVVGSTPQLEIMLHRLTSFRERGDVMDLEKAALGAAPAGADECTLAAIARPDRSPYGRRHVARPHIGRARCARPRHRTAAGVLEILEQHRNCLVEDRGEIALRESVPLQILDTPKLLIRFVRDGQLNLVAIRRQRSGDTVRRRIDGGAR